MQKEIFEKYYTTFFKELHKDIDYEKSAEGFEEIFYDCLPKNKNAKIIDVGCGLGEFLYFLKKKGYYNAEGLEISKEQAEIATKNTNCKVTVVEDTIRFLEENKNQFDCIVMNYLLEHLNKAEIIPFLKGCHFSLKKGGVLVIQTPQLASLVSILERYHDFSHNIIFTESSLKQILQIAGFSEIRFIKPKIKVKLNPKTIIFRLVRFIYVLFLKLIYFIERPYDPTNPTNFLTPLVAVAKKW